MNADTVQCTRWATAVRRAISTLVTLALLCSGVMGRSGVQVLDRATLAALYPVHLHGIPGEEAWLAAHGTWLGLVPNHCHPDPDTLARTVAPEPDEIHSAANLAGAVTCPATRPLPRPAMAVIPLTVPSVTVLAHGDPRPLPPPPRS
jgi:hypothetical protein